MLNFIKIISHQVSFFMCMSIVSGSLINSTKLRQNKAQIWCVHITWMKGECRFIYHVCSWIKWIYESFFHVSDCLMERLNQIKELLPASPEKKSEISGTLPEPVAPIGSPSIQFQSMYFTKHCDMLIDCVNHISAF
jgi:hypothetical protein